MLVKFIKEPDAKSYKLFSDPKYLITDILNSNSLKFIVALISKTYLDVSIESDKAIFKLNEQSEYSIKNNLKFVLKEDWNYLTGQKEVNYHFKLTKKQNIEVLKNHIISLTEKVLKDLNIDKTIDWENFIIEIELSNKLYNQLN